MALPANQTSWPVKPFDQAYHQMAGWDAWYMGDTAQLSKYYAEQNEQRNSWTSGGLVGAVKSFMWGRHTDPSTPKTRLHVPIAADVARTSADLLFAEPPTFVIGEGKSTTQDVLTDMLGGAQTVTSLLEAGEIQSALGGTYLRLVWDKEVFKHIQLVPVHADAAIPEWRYGILSAVTFWEELPPENDKMVYRHLERHERGSIEHALFRGTSSNIGDRIPFEGHTAMEYLVDQVDSESRIATGIQGMTAYYVPNIRPNRQWRNVRNLSPLGRSDFDQNEPLLDAADESWSSYMRELRLGKARAFVDETMLTSHGRGTGGWFDTDQEIFTAVQGIGSLKDGVGIDTYQPEIRFEAHRAIIMDITQSVLRSAGYSAASFSEDPMLNGGQKTATEVNSERELSHRTRDKKIQYWKPALEAAALAALELQKVVYGTQGIVLDQVTARFPVRTGVDPVSMANTLNLLNSAGAISTEQKVRRANPNWDSDDVNDEVKLIQKEQGAAALADPTKVGGDLSAPTPAERAAAALATKQGK